MESRDYQTRFHTMLKLFFLQSLSTELINLNAYVKLA